MCGEYGSQTNRPHYHAIIFNTSEDCIRNAWAIAGVPIGDVHFGTVTGASIGYCLKYMAKPGRIPMHKNDDRIPEFANMSKGIGSNYLSKAMLKYHKKDLVNRMYIPIMDGRKIAMPRYYKDKIYTPFEREFIARHIEAIMDGEDDQFERVYGERAEEMRLEYIVAENRKYFKNQRLEEKL